LTGGKAPAGASRLALALNGTESDEQLAAIKSVDAAVVLLDTPVSVGFEYSLGRLHVAAVVGEVVLSVSCVSEHVPHIGCIALLLWDLMNTHASCLPFQRLQDRVSRVSPVDSSRRVFDFV
jgi:hypothetical protein